MQEARTRRGKPVNAKVLHFVSCRSRRRSRLLAVLGDSPRVTTRGELPFDVYDPGALLLKTGNIETSCRCLNEVN